MSELYPVIKHLHMMFAVISLTAFLVRSGLKFAGSPLLDKKLVRVLPHVNDTLLLLCGLFLAEMLRFNPAEQMWLLAKIILLVLYIVCGLFVLKWSSNNTQRVFGVLVALGCFAGMGILAVTKPF